MTTAVTLKGTIVDPRVSYANRDAQAAASLAEESIAEHTAAETVVDKGDIKVERLQLVALPSLQRVAWYGMPRVGPIPFARVIVDADPAEDTLLDLLRYDVSHADGLLDVTAVSVRTQDLSLSDPWAIPISESVETTRADGAPLLGSYFDGNNDPQLATTEVVAIDMLGNGFHDIMSGADFERYTDPAGEFEVSQPGDQFHPQRLYHLAQSGYATIDRVALGKWDSAVQLYDPMATSAFEPGEFRPRILIAYAHPPTGNAGRATAFLPDPGLDPNNPLDPEGFFPEVYLRPSPGGVLIQNEAVAAFLVQSGTTSVELVLHELGHDYDVFLAPGFGTHYVPVDCDNCVLGCQEDSTDEAYPLTETIAQMFALWQLTQLFPNVDHDTCDLMEVINAGGTTNNSIVHSPGCMGETDEIGLFIRDDDPACLDTTVCDKPYRGDGTADQGGPYRCRTTDGYNTFSVLQAWWNSLHGLYCEPTFPFTCTSVSVTWPPGCDQMGSLVDCVTPDEAAGLAFLYAVRTSPLTYLDFFDSMARFVSCNYGPGAYDDFNQALCSTTFENRRGARGF